MKKKNNLQTSLFPSNFVSMEEYKKGIKPTQHEKAFMNGIIKAARSMGLPCFHIEYYCGNKFYANCSCTPNLPATCKRCGRPILAHCHNRLNKHLAGHFDIVGLSWAIETKHKINKGKQTAKGTERQEKKKETYDDAQIPNIIINESDDKEALSFLQTLSERKELMVCNNEIKETCANTDKCDSCLCNTKIQNHYKRKL